MSWGDCVRLTKRWRSQRSQDEGRGCSETPWRQPQWRHQVSWYRTEINAHMPSCLFHVSVSVGIFLFPELSSTFVFSNLSFGELSWCQRTFNSFLICREHLVDAARRQWEQEIWHSTAERNDSTILPPAASTATYFFTGILPSLLVCREMRTYLRSNTRVLVWHCHMWVNDFACVQSATKEADGRMLTHIFSRKTCLHALFLAAL